MRKQIKFDHAWEIAKWLEENEEKVLYFDVSSDCFYGLVYRKDSGFFHIVEGGEISFSGLWQERTFYITQSWEETVSEEKPVLCWVWDDRDVKFISLVHSVTSKFYLSIKNTPWENAKPLTKEEANKYIWSPEQ